MAGLKRKLSEKLQSSVEMKELSGDLKERAASLRQAMGERLQLSKRAFVGAAENVLGDVPWDRVNTAVHNRLDKTKAFPKAAAKVIGQTIKAGAVGARDGTKRKWQSASNRVGDWALGVSGKGMVSTNPTASYEVAGAGYAAGGAASAAGTHGGGGGGGGDDAATVATAASLESRLVPDASGFGLPLKEPLQPVRLDYFDATVDRVVPVPTRWEYSLLFFMFLILTPSVLVLAFGNVKDDPGLQSYLVATTVICSTVCCCTCGIMRHKHKEGKRLAALMPDPDEPVMTNELCPLCHVPFDHICGITLTDGCRGIVTENNKLPGFLRKKLVIMCPITRGMCGHAFHFHCIARHVARRKRNGLAGICPHGQHKFYQKWHWGSPAVEAEFDKWLARWMFLMDSPLYGEDQRRQEAAYSRKEDWTEKVRAFRAKKVEDARLAVIAERRAKVKEQIMEARRRAVKKARKQAQADGEEFDSDDEADIMAGKGAGEGVGPALSDSDKGEGEGGDAAKADKPLKGHKAPKVYEGQGVAPELSDSSEEDDRFAVGGDTTTNLAQPGRRKAHNRTQAQASAIIEHLKHGGSGAVPGTARSTSSSRAGSAVGEHKRLTDAAAAVAEARSGVRSPVGRGSPSRNAAVLAAEAAAAAAAQAHVEEAERLRREAEFATYEQGEEESDEDVEAPMEPRPVIENYRAPSAYALAVEIEVAKRLEETRRELDMPYQGRNYRLAMGAERLLQEQTLEPLDPDPDGTEKRRKQGKAPDIHELYDTVKSIAVTARTRVEKEDSLNPAVLNHKLRKKPTLRDITAPVATVETARAPLEDARLRRDAQYTARGEEINPLEASAPLVLYEAPANKTKRKKKRSASHGDEDDSDDDDDNGSGIQRARRKGRGKGKVKGMRKGSNRGKAGGKGGAASRRSTGAGGTEGGAPASALGVALGPLKRFVSMGSARGLPHAAGDRRAGDDDGAASLAGSYVVEVRDGDDPMAPMPPSGGLAKRPALGAPLPPTSSGGRGGGGGGGGDGSNWDAVREDVQQRKDRARRARRHREGRTHSARGHRPESARERMAELSKAIASDVAASREHQALQDRLLHIDPDVADAYRADPPQRLNLLADGSRSGWTDKLMPHQEVPTGPQVGDGEKAAAYDEVAAAAMGKVSGKPAGPRPVSASTARPGSASTTRTRPSSASTARPGSALSTGRVDFRGRKGAYEAMATFAPDRPASAASTSRSKASRARLATMREAAELDASRGGADYDAADADVLGPAADAVGPIRGHQWGAPLAALATKELRRMRREQSRQSMRSMGKSVHMARESPV